MISDLSGVESSPAATILYLPRTRRGSCNPAEWTVTHRATCCVLPSTWRGRSCLWKAPRGTNWRKWSNQGFVTRDVPLWNGTSLRTGGQVENTERPWERPRMVTPPFRPVVFVDAPLRESMSRSCEKRHSRVRWPLGREDSLISVRTPAASSEAACSPQ